MPKFLITNIKWDRETDGVTQLVALPSTMTVEAESEDEAIDQASDETGFCIKNAKVQTGGAG
jgi:hypothetical protein